MLAAILQAPDAWNAQQWGAFSAVVFIALVATLVVTIKLMEWFEAPMRNLIVRVMATPQIVQQRVEFTERIVHKVINSPEVVRERTLFTEQIASKCIQAHNSAPDAHAEKFGVQREWARVEVAEKLMAHDESRKAHIDALEPYITRGEFQGAIDRVMAAYASSEKLILQRIDSVKETLDEIVEERRSGRTSGL